MPAGSVSAHLRSAISLVIGCWRGRHWLRIQSRLPDALIRRLVGILVIAIGARYLVPGLS